MERSQDGHQVFDLVSEKNEVFFFVEVGKILGVAGSRI